MLKKQVTLFIAVLRFSIVSVCLLCWNERSTRYLRKPSCVCACILQKTDGPMSQRRVDATNLYLFLAFRKLNPIHYILLSWLSPVSYHSFVVQLFYSVLLSKNWWLCLHTSTIQISPNTVAITGRFVDIQRPWHLLGLKGVEFSPPASAVGPGVLGHWAGIGIYLKVI